MGLLVLVASGCSMPFTPSNPGTGETDPGGLVVSLAGDATAPAGIGASTVVPEIDLREIDTYRVTLDDGPDGAPAPPPVTRASNTQGKLTESVTFSDVVPGTWRISVEALRSASGSEQTILHGQENNVEIAAGMITEIDVALTPADDSSGTLQFAVEWPSDQDIVALEYRTEHDGEISSWMRVPSDEFTEQSGITRGEVSLAAIATGAYLVSWRLDVGTPMWNRYRAAGEEIFHITNGIVSSTTYTLSADDFSAREPDAGSWEQLQDDGGIFVNSDGSVTFTEAGYEAPRGGNNIEVDPEDYSVTFSGTGERRLYMAMPSITAGRLEIDGAHMNQGNGWGVFFHGTDEGGTANFSGYTLQFDPGLGDRIVLRQWVNGGENAPFFQIEAVAAEIDLYAEMNVILEIDGGALTVSVEQPIGSEPQTIIEESDITSLSGVTDAAREEGFMGIRNWSSTNLTIDEVRLYVQD